MTVLPPEPSVEDCHYLIRGDEEQIREWSPVARCYTQPMPGSKVVSPELIAGNGWRYGRPVPTVAQLNAADRAQREADDAIAEMQQTIRDAEILVTAMQARIEEMRAEITRLTTALDDKAANAINHPETF